MGYICGFSGNILRNSILRLVLQLFFAVLNGSLFKYETLISFLEKANSPTKVIDQFKLAFNKTGELQTDYDVYTSGWHNLDGAMLTMSDKTTNSDYLVYISATTERSLRELLLTFPRQSAGMFLISEEWIENRLCDIFEGEAIQIESDRYFRGVKKGSNSESEQRTITKRKDDVATHIRKITSLKGKIEHSLFIIESELLVERAFADGQPIDAILYTTKFVSNGEGKHFLSKAIQENISCYLVNDGLMGSITTTRPIPSIIASIHFNYPHFQTGSGQLNFHHNKDCILLIVENVSNPDNLGMLLRTADAAGISGILLCGEGASPVHKNTIRAARGAIGRLPIFHASDTIMAIELLKETGWQVIGATATGDTDLYNLGFKPNTAIIVGNENSGLSDGTRQHCTELIRLPTAPGQSSLNVGVAAGIFLYEIMRHRIVHE